MARLDVGMAEIAASVGISRSQLSKMLRGVAHIDIEQLAAITTSIGLDPVQVLNEAWHELQLSGPESIPSREGNTVASGLSSDELIRRLRLLFDLNGLDEDDAYRLASAASARHDLWLSHESWHAALSGGASLEPRTLATIAQAFGAPAEFLLQNDSEATEHIEAEAALSRAAADAGVSRIAARGRLSPEAIREVTALMTRHIQK